VLPLQIAQTPPARLEQEEQRDPRPKTYPELPARHTGEVTLSARRFASSAVFPEPVPYETNTTNRGVSPAGISAPWPCPAPSLMAHCP
jgi:hypothetical protein